MTTPSLSELADALLHDEQTFRLVFSLERDAMALIDPESLRFVDVNQAWVDQYGYSAEEAVGKLGPSDVSAEPEATRSAVRNHHESVSGRIELRWHRRRDGTVFPVELTCGTLPFAAQPLLYVAIRDLSRRFQAEDALRRSESTFRTLIESLPYGVFVHRDERLVYVNPAGRTMLGYDADDELADRPAMEIVHPDERDRVRERVRRTVYAGEPAPSAEERFVRRDGSTVTVEVASIPTVFDGKPAALAIVNDVSARKRMEGQLVTADRLASLGRLSASIGHEINNPLAYVLGNVEMLRRLVERLEQGELEPTLPMLRKRLDAIEEGATRVRDIVRDLKTLARHDEDSVEPIDLHHTLDVCIAMADHELRHRAEVVKDYGRSLATCGSESRLGQVFLNLLVNAAQAIPEGHAKGNRVTVRTRADGDHAIVEIEDTGTGLPDDVERIFDPFYTTKPQGTGTGLGLSICHHVVRSLGGEIEAFPAEPRGTCFRVRLPRIDAHGLIRRVSSQPPPPAATRWRVLVVDDEPHVAQVVARCFEGHEVRVAHSGRDALRCLDEDPEVDAIVCDLMMGDLTGMDLHAELSSRRPGLEARMVFMTGGAYTHRARDFLASVANVCLEKPFEYDAAHRAVAEVARAHRAGSA